MIKVEKRKIYWFFIYPFGALVFFILSAIFILSASGYSVHLEDNTLKFNKTGMLIVSSKPSGASIFFDNKENSKKTSPFFSVKLNRLSKGRYTLRLEKDGYQAWEKEVKIFPETVTWANYVLLFSKNPKIEKTEFTGNLQVVVPSQDDKAALFVTRTKDSENLYLIQNSSGEKITLLETIKLPEDKRFSDVKITDWSKDKRYVLFAGTLSGDRRSFVLNTESKALEDLTAITPIKYDTMKFNVQNSEELYALSKGELVRINVRTKNLSQTLERNILYFTFSSEGKIYFILAQGNTRSLWVASTDLNGRTNLSEAIPPSDAYGTKISTKNQRVALLTTNGSLLYLVAKIGDKNTLISLGKNVTDYGWSQDGERLMYKEKEGNVVVLEDDSYRKETSEFEALDTRDYQGIIWYDSRHLLSRKEGKVIIMDFDGTNKVDLGETSPAVRPFFSHDNGDICFVAPPLSEGQTLLSRYKVEF